MIRLRDPGDLHLVEDLEIRALIAQRFEDFAQGEPYDPELHAHAFLVQAGDSGDAIETATGWCITPERFDLLEEHDACFELVFAEGDAGTVIFEGSQGVLLDEWHGFHPHTTWSTITPRHLVGELEAAGRRPFVLGLTRAYSTRHGAGPMPTEDRRLQLPEPDNREGRYQGGWRTGHLDLPALRYAAKVAGRVDGVALSHVDMLPFASRSGVPLLVADSWNSRREPLGSPTHHDLAGLQALTRTAQHARPDLMPLSTDPCEVARLIDAAVGAPVVLIADGPQRSNRVLVGEMGSNRRAG